MTSVDTAVTHPGDEPPGDMASEIAWRVAARLFRDHQPGPDGEGGRPTCATCGRLWPCSGVRMAELGLMSAAKR
jgi:hypothetical protein